jgi:hypothetical protein
LKHSERRNSAWTEKPSLHSFTGFNFMMMMNNVIVVFNDLLPTTAPVIGIVEITPQNTFSMGWFKNGR